MFNARHLGVVGLSALLSQFAVAEQSQVTNQYNEPTRGFFVEHAKTKGTGEASFELHNDTKLASAGGSVRLGLPSAELILNSNVLNDTSQVLVKYAMTDYVANAKGNSQTIQWSLLGGLGYQDIDSDVTDVQRTSLTLGAVASTDIDAVTISLSPKLVFQDSDVNGNSDDDTFINIDVGAYIGLVETQAGLFSVGFESIVTTEDDIDNQFFLGGRWAYNQHFTIDVVPFAFGDADIIGIPGLVRINAAF